MESFSFFSDWGIMPKKYLELVIYDNRGGEVGRLQIPFDGLEDRGLR